MNSPYESWVTQHVPVMGQCSITHPKPITGQVSMERILCSRVGQPKPKPDRPDLLPSLMTQEAKMKKSLHKKFLIVIFFLPIFGIFSHSIQFLFLIEKGILY